MLINVFLFIVLVLVGVLTILIPVVCALPLTAIGLMGLVDRTLEDKLGAAFVLALGQTLFVLAIIGAITFSSLGS